MSDKQETISDIVAEMRREYYVGSEYDGAEVQNLVDRIEAAHRREVEAITAKLEEARHCWKVWSDRADELLAKCDEQYAKLKSVGNADIGNGAKMREALVQVELFLSRVERHAHPTLNPGDRCDACEGTEKLRELVCAALAKPRRNCDVGTAEEQENRFRWYCNSRGTFCGNCPLYNNRRGECRFAWAQMPYEEGGAK